MIPAPEPIHAFEHALRGRRILVTGHTGFTGSWASHWLHAIGAEVHGFSLPPPTVPSLFVDTGVAQSLAGHHIGDIRDYAAMEAAVREIAPDAILHLAAQPLVRRSYVEPLETFDSNLMGTVHVLEAARRCGVAGVVCITTDKVYANREWVYGYRETDRLGGKDPYSASKACAELAVASYRDSMPSWGQKLLIAVARGGNIIGGGDWAEDRLIPDFARAASAGEPIVLRNPDASRPWQHVLCLVHGYMVLLAKVLAGEDSVSDAWNLGPHAAESKSVGQVVERLRARWSELDVRIEPAQLHESKFLALDPTKAERQLGWRPAWSIDDGIDHTADWYAAYQRNPANARAITLEQILAYRQGLAA
jgi:CDP-glucose 4,6-dehydratase